ncbi:type 1 glutamine amidotransferase [Micromonospora inyonensis]|uniref:GMP synthase-Glutamine amidotransferase n=1 Tax=Micromonospora inyonensis TaxID=47866 RepID=A0A1C6S0M9_9ACTN|nr:type 1 glutamine amidotransferase [Micromonospora inyonensis]SCL23027.1 GMP synthase-Glutamine amidotransferase [Micromonospora inyonensis]
MATALVIENDPTDDPRRLGEWLTEAGLTLRVLRPYAGDDLPADLDGYAALVVLGGERQPYPQPDGTPGAPWFPALEGLLRKAVRHRVPTLGICLGGQLLATAHAGEVVRSPSGPEVGPCVVGKRDAAETDPLFRYVPLIPDVIQWHVDEITELPRGATLLAASTRYPHQAFRLGDRAWGFQFHIECDTAMIATWATDSRLLARLGYDPDVVVAACDAVMADIEEVWQPFAARFAALALGELDDDRTPRPTLPLLGH